MFLNKMHRNVYKDSDCLQESMQEIHYPELPEFDFSNFEHNHTLKSFSDRIK